MNQNQNNGEEFLDQITFDKYKNELFVYVLFVMVWKYFFEKFKQGVSRDFEESVIGILVLVSVDLKKVFQLLFDESSKCAGDPKSQKP